MASQTFCRSPGGPPAAAMIVSPGCACSCSRPMIWPWVRTAAVSVTTSESAETVDLSKGVSGSRAAARSACHWSLRARPHAASLLDSYARFLDRASQRG